MRRHPNATLVTLVLAVIASWFVIIWWSRYQASNNLSRMAGGFTVKRPSGLILLSDIGSFPGEYRPAATEVVNDLTRLGDQPAEFFAKVELRKTDNVTVFHLWHQSAFGLEDRMVMGNPGGRCMDVWFDATKGQVVRRGLWQ